MKVQCIKFPISHLLMLNKKIQIKKKNLFFLVSIFFLFLLTGCQFFGKPKIPLNQIENKELPLANQEIEEEKINRFLDGLAVEKGKENLLPISVVLENLSGAPKPILKNSSLIYEIPVEGGLTRFLVFFDLDSLPDDLGPIRSARPYFAELAEEYQSLFIHAGGSSDVLFKLKQGFYKLFNLDEISWMGKYFYRTSGPSPHNLYINKESIQKFLTDQKISQEAKFEPWLFGEGTKNEAKTNQIEIVFSPLYQVKWQYDQANQEYQYWQNGRLYQNKENQELKVKNLIIQYTDIVIIDSEGRRKIKLNGQGKALIFQNSQVIEGKWLKEASRTRFYNNEGEEITFLPGETWINIVSKNNQVNY